MLRHLIFLLRLAITLSLVVIAVILGAALWDSYMLAPWTRDGKVLAQVVDVAPEIPGTIVSVPVSDGQFVHRGQVLYVIDPTRFRLALSDADARLAAARATFAQAKIDARRRQGLDGVVSAEAQQQYAMQQQVAAARLDAARTARDVAALNLTRATLYSPVNGYITHLRTRVGDYATTGKPLVAVIDADSFWVNGYFEETKLARIHVGEVARIKLMAYPTPLTGHVESIGRGIANPDDNSTARGLPTVNPVFTWVRLAQRVPVRIGIDSVPRGVTLVSGLTASVAVGSAATAPAHLRARLLRWLRDHL